MTDASLRVTSDCFSKSSRHVRICIPVHMHSLHLPLCARPLDALALHVCPHRDQGPRWSRVRDGAPDLSALDFFGDSTNSASGSVATARKARKRSEPDHETEPEHEQLLPLAKRSKKRPGDKKGAAWCSTQTALRMWQCSLPCTQGLVLCAHAVCAEEAHLLYIVTRLPPWQGFYSSLPFL